MLTKLTYFALDLTPSYSNHTRRMDYPLQKRDKVCACDLQSFRGRCAAVSQAMRGYFSMWVKILRS
jgi:hypothetical protein